MANIKLKRSATTGKTPLTTELELGEVAINTADGDVFIKKDDGAESIVKLAGYDASTSDPFIYNNVADQAIEPVGSNSFEIGTTSITSADSALIISGARTSSANSDITKIAFKNDTSSTYNMAEIAGQDPSGSHTLGNGRLVFKTSTGGVLSEQLVIDEIGDISANGSIHLADTYNATLMSEVNGELIDFGVNYGQAGNYDNTHAGGLFRIDTRPVQAPSELFSIIWQDVPSGPPQLIEDQVFKVGNQGNLVTTGSITGTSINGSEPSIIITTDDVGDAGFVSLSINHDASGSDILTADRNHTGLSIDIDSSATGGDIDNEHRLYGANINAQSSEDSDLIWGLSSQGRSIMSTADTSTNVGGVYALGQGDNTGGTVSNVHGIYAMSLNDGAGTVTNQYGGYFRTLKEILSTATTTSMHGVYAEIEISEGAGDITNAFCFKAEFDNNVTTNPETAADNSYLFFGNYTGTTPTNAWGIHIDDDVSNHFGGDLNVDGETTVDTIVGTGTFRTTGRVIAGDGLQSVGLTTNDGYGNANVTFNHVGGTPDATGSSGRIECTTDSAASSMSIELGDSTVIDTPVALTQIILLQEDAIYLRKDTDITGILDVSGGITTDTIASTTTDTHLYLSGNGTGIVQINDDTNITGTMNSLNIPDIGNSVGISQDGTALANDTGDNLNVAIGQYSSGNITTGEMNVSIGHLSNRWGAGYRNTAIGQQAMGGYLVSVPADTGSTRNVAIGNLSLAKLAGGDENSCVGENSGYNVTNGHKNVCFGHGAGSSISTGDNNISIGTDAGNLLTTHNNQLRIGNNGSNIALIEGDQLAETLKINGELEAPVVIFSGLYDNGTKSAAWTMTLVNGQYQEVVLSTSHTLTITPPTGNPCTMYLHVNQDATGGRALTLPTGEWVGGTVKNNTTTASAHDLLMIHYTGSGYVFEYMLDLS